MNYDLFYDYIELKVLIGFLVLGLTVTTFSVFYRINRDKKARLKTEESKGKIAELLFTYLGNEDKYIKVNTLNTIIKNFAKSKIFRNELINELIARINNNHNAQKCKELFLEIEAPKAIKAKLLSKNSVTIYKGLMEIDSVNILPDKDIISRLTRHKDLRIRVLASCILFRYNDKINVKNILSLEPFLCPMVEIKVFDELKKQSMVPFEDRYIVAVLNDCLLENISDKMRVFLEKSIVQITNMIK